MSETFRFGPISTPKSLKILITTTVVVSLLVAFTFQLFGSALPFFLLSLTRDGLYHFFLWQLLTFIFVHPIGHGISISFLMHLLFNMYLLWLAGTTIYEQKGKKQFFLLYFGSALLCGLIGALFFFFSGSPFAFAGSTSPLFALLMIWMFYHSNTDFLLFFTLPIKSKWLILSLFGFTLFVDLTQSDFLSFFTHFAAIIIGYLIAVIGYELYSPFSFFHPFENWIQKAKVIITNRWQGHFPQKKIYDISSFKKYKREKFIDDCLEKISKEGKESLTLLEKIRLHWLSRKKGF